MSEVVRLDAGKDAVRAYVEEQASQGLEHVRSLVDAENQSIAGQIGDLSEDEGQTVTPADEWSAFQVLRHMADSIGRSKLRLTELSSGRPFTNPPAAWGQAGAGEELSFLQLRSFYLDGIASVIVILDQADPKIGLDLTADHVDYGPFNWLQWAVYSHHVHTHDHVGQLEMIRAALRA